MPPAVHVPRALCLAASKAPTGVPILLGSASPFRLVCEHTETVVETPTPAASLLKTMARQGTAIRPPATLQATYRPSEGADVPP